MAENVFEELKRYIQWNEGDEAALRALHPLLAPDFENISVVFYDQILKHDEARKALVGGESSVGRLKVTLVAWMDKMLRGPWDNEYFDLRCRIGRVHVRIGLDQHYMFGAMNVIRREFGDRVDRHLLHDPEKLAHTRKALGKIIDLELAIMLHTYREDLLAQQSRIERLSTFGQLVGSIGHELRNPLGVIETSLFILKSRAKDDERAMKHVGRIAEQVNIANAIVTDLLDMIREKPLQAERLALAQVIEAAAQAVQRPEKVHLELDGLMDVPEVEGDPSQLRQVFVNLIDNAVHAAGAEGRVLVEARATEAHVTVAVEDTGPGIDPSIRSRLFEPLVTTKAKGIGLGLALVKRIVERHRGTITHEPRDKGARFVVRLPRAG